MAEVTREQVVDFLSNMPVMQMAELIGELEEKWGVKAAPAAVAMAAGPAAAGEAAAEEKTEFDVILADVGGKKIFTDAMGMTLYTNDKDGKGKSNCYDKCAANWPPLKAEAGAKAEGEWTVIDRTDGTKMWAYDGKPVYTFIKDKKVGDMAGEGVAGVWHAAKAD